MQVLSRPDPLPDPKLSTPTPAAGSLELKAEKQSAHSHSITSVAFNFDGTKIVSGSWDKTIKVWDAGALALAPRRIATALAADASSACPAGTLELMASKESAHSRDISSVAYSPDGKTIVSGSWDQTIKVWDAGAIWGRKCRNALFA